MKCYFSLLLTDDAGLSATPGEEKIPQYNPTDWHLHGHNYFTLPVELIFSCSNQFTSM
jgi:hypothetical protein